MHPYYLSGFCTINFPGLMTITWKPGPSTRIPYGRSTNIKDTSDLYMVGQRSVRSEYQEHQKKFLHWTQITSRSQFLKISVLRSVPAEAGGFTWIPEVDTRMKQPRVTRLKRTDSRKQHCSCLSNKNSGFVSGFLEKTTPWIDNEELESWWRWWRLTNDEQWPEELQKLQFSWIPWSKHVQPTTTVSQLLFLCGVTSSTPSRVHPFLDLLCRNKPTPRDKRGPACHQLIQCLLHDMPQLCCAVAWFRYSHLPQRTRQVMKLWKDTQNRKKMCGFRTYMMQTVSDDDAFINKNM